MPANDRLFYLLEQLDIPDLILLLRSALRANEGNWERCSRQQLINAASEKLRAAAGHSFINFFRDPHEFSYKQILIDVADKLNDKYYRGSGFYIGDRHSEAEIEAEIIRLFELKIKKWWEKLKDSEKEKVVYRINQTIEANIVRSIAQGP
ncbi:hypothetical protein QUF80_15900 [Desulfococcaceae bacterium HSG8]|nr:hypothetical protein [Desulfococcaceae bacterium HSG8]